MKRVIFMLLIATSLVGIELYTVEEANAQSEISEELRQSRGRFRRIQRRVCLRRRPNRSGASLRRCTRRRVGRLDPDRDGIRIGRDNCPDVRNPDQADSNNDGIGDACTPGFDRVILQEVTPNSRTITLLNESTETVDLSSYWFCVNNGGGYVNLADSSISIEQGSLAIQPGGTATFNLSRTNVAERFSLESGTDIGLYSVNQFANPDAIVDYVRFRDTQFSGRINVAEQANIWTADTFVDISAFPAGAVITRTGDVEGVEGWSASAQPVADPTPTPTPIAAPFDLNRTIISEVDPIAERVELINQTDRAIDLSPYWLCVNNGGGYINMANGSLQLLGGGDLILEPGEALVVDLSSSSVAGRLANNGGTDVGLYNTNTFGNPNALIDYVKVGANAPIGREAVAVQAGLWAAETFVSGVIPNGFTAQRINGENGAAGWTVAPSTFGLGQ